MERPQCREGLGVGIVLELSRDGDRKKLHGGVKFDKLPHTVMFAETGNGREIL